MKRFALAMVFVFGVAAVGCDSNPGGPAAPSAPSAPTGAAAPTPTPKALGGGKKSTAGVQPVGAQ